MELGSGHAQSAADGFQTGFLAGPSQQKTPPVPGCHSLSCQRLSFERMKVQRTEIIGLGDHSVAFDINAHRRIAVHRHQSEIAGIAEAEMQAGGTC